MGRVGRVILVDQGTGPEMVRQVVAALAQGLGMGMNFSNIAHQEAGPAQQALLHLGVKHLHDVTPEPGQGLHALNHHAPWAFSMAMMP